jgi:hypothetical protein
VIKLSRIGHTSFRAIAEGKNKDEEQNEEGSCKQKLGGQIRNKFLWIEHIPQNSCAKT